MSGRGGDKDEEEEVESAWRNVAAGGSSKTNMERVGGWFCSIMYYHHWKRGGLG